METYQRRRRGVGEAEANQIQADHIKSKLQRLMDFKIDLQFSLLSQSDLKMGYK